MNLRAVCRALTRRRESGQTSVLILGFVVIAAVLILGTVDVTAMQIARIQLSDVADAAALDAADALDERAVYGQTPAAVPLSDSSIQRSAAAYLAQRERPVNVTSWTLAPGTGRTPAGEAAVVLQSRVALPITGGLLSGLGQEITIVTQARASAPLR